ncbi:MAG: putative 26S proteasome non-ATPase regulatory subunit 12, partial [Streblomastix strix]
MEVEVVTTQSFEKSIERARELLYSEGLNQAIAHLIQAEKIFRKKQDADAETEILITIAKFHFEAKKYSELGTKLEELTKVRGPIIIALKALFSFCCEKTDEIENIEEKGNLLQTLRRLTNGNTEYEATNINLTKKLSSMKEKVGQLEEAAEILFEIQVETAATLTRRTRAALIIDQIRLSLATDNYIQAAIQAKKFSLKGTEKFY